MNAIRAHKVTQTGSNSTKNHAPGGFLEDYWPCLTGQNSIKLAGVAAPACELNPRPQDSIRIAADFTPTREIFRGWGNTP